jgi:hypothetical protein
METAIQTAPAKNYGHISTEPIPNPLSFKAGEIVLMDEEFDNPTEVEILKIGVKGYGGVVKEVVSGKKWSLSLNCLTRK